MFWTIVSYAGCFAVGDVLAETENFTKDYYNAHYDEIEEE